MALISTLTDNFDDNSTDASLWVQSVWGEATSYSNGTVSESGGKVAVTPGGTGGNGAGYTSVNTYDAQDQRVFVLMDPGTLANGQNCTFYVGTSNNQYYAFFLIPGAAAGNQIIVRLRNGFNANVYAGSLPLSGPIWLSIRHQVSTNRWYFEYADPASSADPPSSWTSLASRGSDFSAAAVKAGFGVYSGVTVTSPRTQFFDGFNTATAGASGVTGTAAGSISLTGSSASTVAIAATASGSVGLTGASASNVAIAATGAGSVAFSGSSGGAVAIQGTATSALALSATSSAAVLVAGAGSGTFDLTGSAATGGGSGSVTGAFALGGQATVTVAITAAANDNFRFFGSAIGVTPAIGLAELNRRKPSWGPPRIRRMVKGR